MQVNSLIEYLLACFVSKQAFYGTAIYRWERYVTSAGSRRRSLSALGLENLPHFECLTC